MTALSATLLRRLSGTKVMSFKVKNASTIYTGSMVAIDSTGYAIAATGAAAEKLVGRALPTPDPANLGQTTIVGDSGHLVEVTVACEPEVFIQAAVTGVTAITDLMKLVYLSDDNVMTLTRPARGQAIGFISRWYSSTTCDVTRFDVLDLQILSASGSGADAKLLAYLSYADIASGDYPLVTPPYRGSVRSITATVLKAFTTGASGSVAITLKIVSTAITGGIITINTTGGSGGTAADVCAGTAITAANVFSESDALKLSMTLTSTFTAGSALVFGTFDALLGV